GPPGILRANSAIRCFGHPNDPRKRDMANLQELLAQKAEIDRQISDARRTERNDAVAKVRALMAEHGLTAADLIAKAPGPRASTSRRKDAAHYPDPVPRHTS